MTRVLLVGTVASPACYGGFETLVEYLAAEKNSDITVYCSGKTYNQQSRRSTYKNARLVYLPFKANGLHSVVYDIVSLFYSAFKKADSVLILGVSGCLILPIFKIFSSARIVTNIDGLEWKRVKWGRAARVFLRFSEKMAVKFSDVIISDNQAIADYVKTEYNVESEVIAYGGDHAFPENMPITDKGYAFALCRIEPENNVAMILQAFSEVDKKLIFVGNWKNSAFGQNLFRQYSSYPNITLLDPIYDLNQLAELRAGCSLYVHGHSAGGTNPSLVELMHFGKKIYCFDCNYNRASTENRADYFSDKNQIIELLLHDTSGHENPTMAEIAKRRYTWDKVREQYYKILRG